MCQQSEYGGTDAAATTGEPEHKKERRIRARSSAVTGHAEGSEPFENFADTLDRI